MNNDAASYLHAPTGVKASLANPSINTADAVGDSYTSIENLTGSRFNDTLTGNNQANRITGGLGSDMLKGDGGNDLFEFNSTKESPPGLGRDRIIDFDAGGVATSVDKIVLTAIDAKTGPGNQAFTFIGTAAFTSTKGQLRVQQAGSTAIVQGDVNGDGAADFEIALLNFTNLSTLTAIDFVL
jgi:chitinase